MTRLVWLLLGVAVGWRLGRRGPNGILITESVDAGADRAGVTWAGWRKAERKVYYRDGHWYTEPITTWISVGGGASWS